MKGYARQGVVSRERAAPYGYAQDSLGSVIGLFDKTGTYRGGYSYSPYGEARATGTNTAMTYIHLRYISGYYDDATKLYKLGARTYDPTIGRFTQYDPSGQEAHPYAYAGCNPISNSDPTGFACTPYTFSAIAGTIGGFGALAGAGVGAGVGLLGGPLAPVTVPGGAAGGALVGGTIGVLFGAGYALGSNCAEA